MKYLKMFTAATISKALVVLCLLQVVLVYGEYSYDDDDQDVEELVIDETQDVHTKQNILIDRSYNSSFTISIPMLSVVVPGTGKANGVVRLSISHITLWSLVSMSFMGLIYPALLGPRGKLHKRNFDGSEDQDSIRVDPTILDHINEIVDIAQVYEDVKTLVPWEESEDCLKRSLCEAHENVVEFGVAGMALRGMYSVDEGFTAGKNSNMTCAEIYPRCLVSPLGLYQETWSYFFDE